MKAETSNVMNSTTDICLVDSVIYIFLCVLFIQLVMKAIEGERLSLSGVQRSDMGGYLCIASNGIPPSVSKRYDVQVNCKYPIN